MCEFKDSVAKWSPLIKKYIPYMVHNDASFFEEDMDKIVKCAECNRDIEYGDCFSSRLIHTRMGYGYAVCPKCHEEEIREEFRIH